MSRRGADLLVETLIRLGVRDAFNVIGLGMYPLGDAFAKRSDEIRYISHFNETNLALTAQGYAHATRKAACAVVYYSSGTALAMVALTVAWADRIPLVIISCTGSVRASGRDQYAAVPHSITAMSAQYVKWSFEIPSAERIPEAIARAFAIAEQPPMGPVHLAIPSDVFDEVVAGEVPCADFERTRSYALTCADEAGLVATADLLAAAERPVLMFGSEVGQYSGAVAEAIRVADALGAPVLIDDQPAYLAFPTTRPNYIGKRREHRDFANDADAALSVGIEFTHPGLPAPPALPPGMRLAALSVDPALTVRQVWPDIALTGHPQPSLARLATLLAQRVSPETLARNRARTAAERMRRIEHAARVRAMHRGKKTIFPGALLEAVNAFCAGEWIVVEAVTSVVTHFDTLIDFNDPRDFHGLSGKGSAQGWGAPTAIGVQLATPDRRVLALLGDGNLMFTSSSIYLAASMQLPMIFVVANNGGWAHVRDAIKMGNPNGYGDAELSRMGWLFTEPGVDYVALARSFGLRASRATSPGELAAQLAEAGAGRSPWLIEAITEGGDPA